MIDCNYLMELLTPPSDGGAPDRTAVNRFAERYYRAVDHAMGISVPDNPMGRPRHSFVEIIATAGLPVAPQRTVMNLNTFHSKEELDRLLSSAAGAATGARTARAAAGARG